VHLIPPGAADTAPLSAAHPESAGDKITLHAKLKLPEIHVVQYAVRFRWCERLKSRTRSSDSGLLTTANGSSRASTQNDAGELKSRSISLF